MPKGFTYLFIASSFLFSCKEAPAPEVLVDFYVEGDGCTAPCQMVFWNNSMNDVHWEWDFGNGTTSFAQNDTATFVNDSTYAVKLKVWNKDNIPDSLTKSVTVY